MKKKIKFILILLAIAIVIELGAIIAIQAHKIFTETMQQNTTEEAKGQTKTKNKKKKLSGKSTASSSDISEPAKPEPGPVDESYFDDAVFLGDSRTVGLRAFGSFNNSGYFAKTGISVNSFFMYPA